MIFEYFKPSINYRSFGDRFSSTWTFGLLLVLSLITALRQYFGPNAICWTPSQFHAQYSKYSDQMCWMSRQYREEERGFGVPRQWVIILAGDHPDKLSSKTLYQLLPLILVLQALLFKLPDVLIKVSDTVFGFGCSKINGMIKGYSSMSEADRKCIAKDLSEYLNDVFSSRFIRAVPFGITTFILLMGKLLFFVNAVTQISIMGGYLSPPNMTSYGQYVLESMISTNSKEIAFSPAFPREIMCEFTITNIRNEQKYTLQCQLPINEFYDQVYFFVWIWLVVVCVVSGTSGFVFLVKNILPMKRNGYIITFLRMSNLNPIQQQVATFTSTDIGQDGVFILKLIGDLSSDILVRDVVVNIWNIHHVPVTNVQHTGHTSEPSAPQRELPMKQTDSEYHMSPSILYSGSVSKSNPEAIPLDPKE